MPFWQDEDIINNMKTFELKHKKVGFFKGILSVLAIVAGLMVLTFILYLLKEILHFPYMFWVEFVLVIVLAVYLAKTKLIEFTYYLDGDILRVDRIASARPKLDLFTREQLNSLCNGNNRQRYWKIKMSANLTSVFSQLNSTIQGR